MYYHIPNVRQMSATHLPETRGICISWAATPHGDVADGNPHSVRQEGIGKEGWRRSALNRAGALAAHRQAHAVLYTDEGGALLLTTFQPPLQVTEAQEVPSRTPQPKMAHHSHRRDERVTEAGAPAHISG